MQTSEYVMKTLVLEGELWMEEHGWLNLDRPATSEFLAVLLEQLIQDYAGRSRSTFEALDAQKEILILEGFLYAEGAELSFESPSQSGFLEDLLIAHFRPELAYLADEDEEFEEPVVL